MIALVLSGAGNRGPIQIGALRAIIEYGIEPDFMVGTSAGAINASYVASRDLSLATLESMRGLWKSVDADSVYPGNLLGVAWRVLRGRNSLYPNDGMRRLITGGLPSGVRTFADLSVPLYVAAVDLVSSRLFVFGEDLRVELVDVVLASSAVPIVHPPVTYHGLQLVDGGVLANVAASFAMDKGADVIYVINVGYGGESLTPASNIINVVQRTVGTMMAQSILRDLDRARDEADVALHHIHIPLFWDLGHRDFTKIDAMIEAGYNEAIEYLAAPRPQTVERVPRPKPDLGATVPGAREFIPPYV